MHMSSSQTLYTKYRPQSFKDVLGQNHITEVLKESIALGSIAHAYLFFGTRGTGKTSIARIVAQELGTASEDLYEIDAASNNGVDEIRELRDAVSILPFKSKYKVYILDEVHMLSKSAFNALLKTLEEPPAHVIFILATTELHKVPDTVISRCEVYTFKKPTQTILKDMVIKTAKKEGITLDSGSADLIALLGEGSFRDTHGILQKVLHASSDSKITLEEVEKVTGAPQSDLVNQYIDSLATGQIEEGIQAITTAVSQNIDMSIYISMIVSKVRHILLARYSKSAREHIRESVSERDFEYITKCAEESQTINSQTLKVLLDAYVMRNKSHISSVPLEIVLFDLQK